jgi:hypothetical protein
VADIDRSRTDNVPSQASGPALRPELDMAALVASATPRAPRSVDEINTGLVIVLNGEGGLWWA